ncbi:hypothetical protein I315_05247 [Cryptococcus gattii Ru294]|uniref:Uncharacterized protein n=2 Tax=Cryptococcus gattii TaxID=37769 RepID=E6RE87_CRYGW|nr:uncharacterized protein CGB_L3040C [Cryptococcus gattii WM276]KIR52297.1 hypothetical protein I315_05247 [Cryptococcus gattii Ru294]KIR76550.1 hypothetical protein I306_06462 [Cryptococcus gattii EJB2]KIY32109.1 hypothetical protein I305_05408 [Cryptococcus gattii E566]KJE02420.1 hypothetical protein I311_03817 [Cryptococcus gattii NT-10]ADV25379.1 hypothetical protein CNBL2400 [Cryptococcus gattii WM276]
MLAAAALASLLATIAVNAVTCVQFDSSWNLYAFGGDQDVKIGDNNTWSSPSTTPLSTTGRPPWTGNNTQCILSQTNNAMYVIGADSDNLSNIYVYDFAGNSWSTQNTSRTPSDLGNSRSSSVLDHDTNVFFTLTTDSGLYQLDLSSITNSASSDALIWEAVENPSFSVDGYTVTAAQAANHIFYFGVPGTASGSAYVFVVHYAYFQPKAQAFNGTTFPDASGQAISIPSAANNVPYSMVFIPHDFSDTYIVTHWTHLSNYSVTSDAPFDVNLINSTQTLPAPTSQDEAAAYAASPYAIVQIDAAGDIYYMSNPVQSDYTVSSSASWEKLGYSLTLSKSEDSSSSSTTSGTSTTTGATHGSASGTASRSGSTDNASASASTNSSSGARKMATRGDVLGLFVGALVVAAGILM